MLKLVVDQCLSLASAASGLQRTPGRTGAAARGSAWQAPLARYPRLQAAMEKAEADGLLARRRSTISR